MTLAAPSAASARRSMKAKPAPSRWRRKSSSSIPEGRLHHRHVAAGLGVGQCWAVALGELAPVPTMAAHGAPRATAQHRPATSVWLRQSLLPESGHDSVLYSIRGWRPAQAGRSPHANDEEL